MLQEAGEYITYKIQESRGFHELRRRLAGLREELNAHPMSLEQDNPPLFIYSKISCPALLMMFLLADTSLDRRMSSFQLAMQFIECAEICFGRSHHDVGIRTVAVDNAPGFLQSYRNFTLGIGTASDGINGK